MSSLPNDLIPLPTTPYDERPVELPLDREEVRTALWLHRGNISEAAVRLKVPSSRLRSFVKNSPYLLREQEEAREKLVDIAEEVVYEALTDPDDTGRRDQMARFVLNSQGRSRGYGTGAGPSVNINNKGGTISIAWADGTAIGPQRDGAEKVIDGDFTERVRAHE